MVSHKKHEADCSHELYQEQSQDNSLLAPPLKYFIRVNDLLKV